MQFDEEIPPELIPYFRYVKTKNLGVYEYSTRVKIKPATRFKILTSSK